MNISTGIRLNDYGRIRRQQSYLIIKADSRMESGEWTDLLCEMQKVLEATEQLKKDDKIDHFEQLTLKYYNEVLKIKIEELQKLRELKERYTKEYGKEITD